MTRGEQRRSRYQPLPAVARQLGFAGVSYGTPTGPSERSMTKRAIPERLRMLYRSYQPNGRMDRPRSISQNPLGLRRPLCGSSSHRGPTPVGRSAAAG